MWFTLIFKTSTKIKNIKSPLKSWGRLFIWFWSSSRKIGLWGWFREVKWAFFPIHIIPLSDVFVLSPLLAKPKVGPPSIKKKKVGLPRVFVVIWLAAKYWSSLSDFRVLMHNVFFSIKNSWLAVWIVGKSTYLNYQQQSTFSPRSDMVPRRIKHRQIS